MITRMDRFDDSSSSIGLRDDEFTFCCFMGHLDIVQLLLKQTGIDVNKSNENRNIDIIDGSRINGVTPLMGMNLTTMVSHHLD